MRPAIAKGCTPLLFGNAITAFNTKTYSTTFNLFVHSPGIKALFPASAEFASRHGFRQLKHYTKIDRFSAVVWCGFWPQHVFYRFTCWTARNWEDRTAFTIALPRPLVDVNCLSVTDDKEQKTCALLVTSQHLPCSPMIVASGKPGHDLERPALSLCLSMFTLRELAKHGARFSLLYILARCNAKQMPKPRICHACKRVWRSDGI